MRAPEQLGQLDIAKAFHAELMKRDIKRFEVEDWDLTTFEFMNHVNKAMNNTLSLVINHYIQVTTTSDNVSKMSDHAGNIVKINYSWSISKESYPRWHSRDDLDVLVDYDKISINTSYLEASKYSKSITFLYLEHFIIDLENHISYKKKANCR